MKSLTFSDVLWEAVEAEATTASFYERIVAHAGEQEATSLFLAMAAIQRAHGQQVASEGRQILNSREPHALHTGAIPAHQAQGWDELDNLSFDEALQIALECQTRAVEYYSGLASLFDGAEETMLRRAADVERSFARQLQGAIARREHARRRAHTLTQIISSVVVARRSAARTLVRLGARPADEQTGEFVRKVVAYEEQRSAEIEGLAPQPITAAARSPAFAISAAEKGSPLDLETAMRMAIEAEEKTASYCTRGAATLRGSEAKVLRSLAVECIDNAEAIASALGRISIPGARTRSSRPRMAA